MGALQNFCNKDTTTKDDFLLFQQKLDLKGMPEDQVLILSKSAAKIQSKFKSIKIKEGMSKLIAQISDGFDNNVTKFGKYISDTEFNSYINSKIIEVEHSIVPIKLPSKQHSYLLTKKAIFFIWQCHCLVVFQILKCKIQS